MQNIGGVPAVLIKDGFSVRMYFNDHAPPHVHVVKAAAEATISLLRIEILTVHGMTASDAAKAKKLVHENRDKLLRKWIELHGPANI